MVVRRGNLGENRFGGNAVESLFDRNKLIANKPWLDFGQEEFSGFL
jgi:hypothetical protein